MAKQTFVIQRWYGAPTYIQAARREVNEGYKPQEYGYDFDRVDCRRAETALRYLKSWRDQAKEKGYDFLCRDLLREDAHYEIIATPDGYNLGEVVASGMMKDL